MEESAFLNFFSHNTDAENIRFGRISKVAQLNKKYQFDVFFQL